MSGPLLRNAIGCAIACGGLMVGPVIVGTAVAKADLVGVGGGGVDVLGIEVLGSGGARSRAPAAPPPAGLRRPPPYRRRRVHAVSVHPGDAPGGQPDQWVEPAVAALPVAYAPAVAFSARRLRRCPLRSPRLQPSRSSGRRHCPLRRPSARRRKRLPIPATIEPGPGRHVAPADSYPPPAEIPDSFRVGYAEYLRAATTSDIVFGGAARRRRHRGIHHPRRVRRLPPGPRGAGRPTGPGAHANRALDKMRCPR